MGLIQLNLDGRPVTAPEHAPRAWLDPGVPTYPRLFKDDLFLERLDPAAPIHWQELDKLKDLREIHYAGRDAGVARYVAGRHQVRILEWIGHGRRRIDLGGSALHAITTDASGGGRLSLRLPAGGSMTQLKLFGPYDLAGVEVIAANHGEGLSLELGLDTLLQDPPAIRGLERLISLSLFNVRSLRLADLLSYEALEYLSLVGGPVCDWQLLPRLRPLRRLRVTDCYDLRPESFPAPADLPPSLEEIVVHDVRRAEAEALLRRLGDYKGRLIVRGRRDDGWARAHHENPFRDWDAGLDWRVADAARKTYRKASRALDRLGPAAGAAKVRPALLAFVKWFNRIGAGLDPIRRREIAAAYGRLAARAPKARAAAEEWFEEWCEF